MPSQYSQLLNFPHLLNPLDTVVKSFSTGDQKFEFFKNAPQGTLQLSKNPVVNSALWNAIYSGLFLGGAGLITTLIANKLQENKTRKALNKGLRSRLEATHPMVIADPNLNDITAYTALPNEEMDKIKGLLDPEERSMKKTANDSEEPGVIGNTLAKGFGYAFPLIAAAALTAGGIYLGNELEKESLKKRLKKELIGIRNAQAYVDRKILEEQGLITDNPGIKKEADDPSLWDTILAAPVAYYALMGAGIGGVVYALMRNRDKNLATIKFLRKMQAGKNDLGAAPALSILDLPAKPEEMLKLPGDSKKETFMDEEDKSKKKALENRTKEAKKLPNSEIIDVVPIDEAGIVAPLKKDALFL